MLVGWITGEEAGGSTCVTKKVVDYYLVFNNMVAEVWCSGGETYPGVIIFWSTGISPFWLKSLWYMQTSMFQAACSMLAVSPYIKKVMNLATCSKQQHNIIAENI